jgi:hypothetical protein
MKIAALLLASFSVGYGVAVWRMKIKLAGLDAQLKANTDKLRAALLKFK